MWISASGPASPVLGSYGRRVGAWGPGLTSYSADAVFGLSCDRFAGRDPRLSGTHRRAGLICLAWEEAGVHRIRRPAGADRKSTRLNSSHVEISYAVFCLKKKKKNQDWLICHKDKYKE